MRAGAVDSRAPMRVSYTERVPGWGVMASAAPPDPRAGSMYHAVYHHDRTPGRRAVGLRCAACAAEESLYSAVELPFASEIVLGVGNGSASAMVSCMPSRRRGRARLPPSRCSGATTAKGDRAISCPCHSSKVGDQTRPKWFFCWSIAHRGRTVLQHE